EDTEPVSEVTVKTMGLGSRKVSSSPFVWPCTTNGLTIWRQAPSPDPMAEPVAIIPFFKTKGEIQRFDPAAIVFWPARNVPGAIGKLTPLRLRLPVTPPSAGLNESVVPQTFVDPTPLPTDVGVTSLPFTSRVPDKHMSPPTLTWPGVTPGASVKF